MIDSAGIEVEDESEWYARKHCSFKRWARCKINLGIDEQTLEIRAVDVSCCQFGDAPVLPDQIPEHQEISSAKADGAYDT